ncbi:MAG: Fe-S cluster assembly sulfur transfer protein SufU [Planctomycetota bacterium]|jgi:nitrogen fixation NifU-like protein
MSELSDLYQEVILDHNKSPRNSGTLETPPAVSAEGDNPLCGDHLIVYLVVDGDVVRDIKFEGHGCAISTASASVMTETLMGRTRAEVEEIFRTFHDLVTAEDDTEPDIMELGEMAALAGVRKYPMRVKCATLAWHTLRSALAGQAGKVTTE